ncbi:MAG: hypothetical protein ACI8S6_005385 [Myxococcota bacterium]|jgi:hypothetical protein
MVSLLLSSIAWGGTFEVTLDAAREAMIAGDSGLAAGHIRAAEVYAPQAGAIIEASQLARIWMYRGMLAHQQGGLDDLAMDIWRQALGVDAEIAWDEGAYDDNGAHGLFEALRQEASGRLKVSVLHPGAVGAAVLYVDGRRVAEGDTVVEGIHLAQIECPDEQGTFGMWTELDRRMKWLAMCPDGVDTTVVVAAAEGGGDEFGDFGPTFGGGGAVDTEVYEPLPPAPLEPYRKKVSMPLLLGAGGAALVSGGMYLAALSSRAQFDDVSSRELQSATDVSDLRQQTNSRVFISAGTGAVALGLYTAAFISF